MKEESGQNHFRKGSWKLYRRGVKTVAAFMKICMQTCKLIFSDVRYVLDLGFPSNLIINSLAKGVLVMTKGKKTFFHAIMAKVKSLFMRM